MNEARFIELLGSYGAELSRWPDDERGEAEVFLEVAPHRIKDIWESERSFDHLLALEKDGSASIALETAILSASPSRHARRPAGLGRGSFPQWVTGGALAASLALGFAVGYAAEPQDLGPAANIESTPMLSLSGAGAGAVFVAALNDSGN
jgi:hypothetical protein